MNMDFENWTFPLDSNYLMFMDYDFGIRFQFLTYCGKCIFLIDFELNIVKDFLITFLIHPFLFNIICSMFCIYCVEPRCISGRLNSFSVLNFPRQSLIVCFLSPCVTLHWDCIIYIDNLFSFHKLYTL